MKKNNSLLYAIASVAMALCMSLGFQSCGQVDNPLEEINNAVQTVATVTGTDPSAVTAALQAIVTDEAVAAAVAKGEPIKITVAGSGVSTDAADQTITIPQKSGAAIEINFAEAPTGTDSNALVLEASEGADALPGDANNNLVVTMPPSEGLAITIELPETTVTLKTDGTGNVVYKDVIAKTAKQTIIIDKGVTIKEHELVGGNIIVKDGGAIETLAVTIKDNDGMICLGSWWSGVWFKDNGPEPKYEIKTEVGGYYMPKNVRIKKGAGNYLTAWTNGPEEEYIDKLIIGEGVTVALGLNSSYKSIQGEGESRQGLNVRGWIGPTFREGTDWDNPTQEDVNGYYYSYDFDANTESVSNVTITEERGEINPANIPFVDQQTANYTEVRFCINYMGKTNGETTFTFDKCDFPANSKFDLTFTNFKRDANGNVEYEDVTLYCCYLGDGEWDIHDYPSLEELQTEHPDMTVEVGDRERGGYWIVTDRRPVEEAPTDFKGILVFKDCTINGAAVTSSNLIHSGKFGPGTVAYKVKIGNTVYNVNRGAWDDDVSLSEE